MKKYNYLLFFYFFLFQILQAQTARVRQSTNKQTVAVVLSGGGAAGFAHIGVLRALEENNIPIDYIAGTSMGAIVGSLYAMGWSLDSIERYARRPETSDIVFGKIDPKYIYYYQKPAETAEWISWTSKIDTGGVKWASGIPLNIANMTPVDWNFMEITASSSAASNYNFDSLFVPFRCITANLTDRKPMVFRSGDLGVAVRASSSYPFMYRPVRYKDKVLVDGGIYNNFPSNTLYEDFMPDYIIGSAMTMTTGALDEENVLEIIKNMVMSPTNYEAICDNMIVIKPHIPDDFTDFSFDRTEEVIQLGYATANENMNAILKTVPLYIDSTERAIKRQKYTNKTSHYKLDFEDIEIQGVNDNQSFYMEGVLSTENGKKMDYEHIKKRYFRLSTNEKISHTFPTALYNTNSGKYLLNIDAKIHRKLSVSLGGFFSSNNTTSIQWGAEYKQVGIFGLNIYTKGYFGRFYQSILGGVKIDLPYNIPVFFQADVVANKFNYFSNYKQFLTTLISSRPSSIQPIEVFTDFSVHFPAFNKGKIITGVTKTFENYVDYDQDFNLDIQSKKYQTQFNFSSWYTKYERSTLNRKQYANQGTYTLISMRYVGGKEIFRPGSLTNPTLKDTLIGPFDRNYWQVKFKLESYVLGKFRSAQLGFLLEFVHSSKNPFAMLNPVNWVKGTLKEADYFHNYFGTKLYSAAFQPIPEMKTTFLDNFRAYTYGAAGLKMMWKMSRNMDFRLEGYVFQPYIDIQKKNDSILGQNYQIETLKAFSRRHFVLSSALVYSNPIAQISVTGNFYSKPGLDYTQFKQLRDRFYLSFNIGYFIFNKRALD